MVKKEYTEIDARSCELLRNLLYERKWNAVDLARLTKRSPDVVRRWLRGERVIPLEAFVRIAQGSKVNLNVWFDLIAGVEGTETSGTETQSSALSMIASLLALGLEGNTPVRFSINIEPGVAGKLGLGVELQREAITQPCSLTAVNMISPTARTILEKLETSVADADAKAAASGK